MDREQALDVALEPDRAPVRQGLGHEDERPGARVDGRDLDRLAGARPRPRRRRAAARPHRRDLRPRVLRQDDARLPRDRRGAAPAAASAPSSTPSTRWTRMYARRIGVNIDDLLVSQPDNGEQALEIAELLVRSGALDVVAVDSVAALTPKAEIEGEMGDSHVGLQARLMSPGAAQARRHAQPHRHDLHLHEPAAREDRRHVRLPGDDTGRPRAQVLLVGPARHPPHRDARRKASRRSATACA